MSDVAIQADLDHEEEFRADDLTYELA